MINSVFNLAPGHLRIQYHNFLQLMVFAAEFIIRLIETSPHKFEVSPLVSWCMTVIDTWVINEFLLANQGWVSQTFTRCTHLPVPQD